jgi:hypothetical protein
VLKNRLLFSVPEVEIRRRKKLARLSLNPKPFQPSSASQNLVFRERGAS